MNETHDYRVAKSLLAQATCSGAKFFVYVKNLGREGLEIACSREMEIDDPIELALNIPGLPTIKVAGRIVWQREASAVDRNKYQYGVSFTKPSDEYDEYMNTVIRVDFERRQQPRFQDILEIKSKDVLDLLSSATSDVSASGLYIRTSRPLNKGDVHTLMLTGTQLSSPIICKGEVVSVFETPMDELDHVYGAGIRFISFTQGHEERFKEYLRELERLFRFHRSQELGEEKKPDPEEEGVDES